MRFGKVFVEMVDFVYASWLKLPITFARVRISDLEQAVIAICMLGR
jgi:hypothetical protein